MTPFLVRKKLVSFKVEIAVVLGVLIVIIFLPIVAVASVTNVTSLFGNNPEKNGASLYIDPANPKDLYDYGYCTYWVALRRIQVGESIPNDWGNAINWATRAFLNGYSVNHTPTQWAIMQTQNSPGGLGHVAFVESVDADGTWHISEMNAVGWDETNNRTMPASAAVRYNFIHEQTP
ncbi:MAG TPA: CHAP domain-containing protein [Candidatus Saccharimonadia bacterium]|nr:CHAP domain-containing protein [Candidatus Saccharimonadia bacterium]